MSYAPVLGPPPPPGYFEENYGPRLLAINCSLFGIAAVTMILRIYVRVFILKMFGIDDWLMLLAMTAATTTTALFIKAVTLGMGRHIDFSPVPHPHAFPMENFTPYFLSLYIYAVVIVLAYSLIKLSIGFFLLRLADRTRWRVFLICTIVFLIAFTISSAMAIIFQCVPIQAAWNYNLRPPTGPAKCLPLPTFTSLGILNSTLNITTDLVFALLPLPILWSLHLSTQTKLGLSLCMALGLFATATAIYKTPIQFHFFEEADFTGRGSSYYVWQVVEMHVGIVGANLPTLRPLVGRWWGGLRTVYASGSGGGGEGRSAMRGYGVRSGGESVALSSVGKRSGGDGGGREWKGGNESEECIWRVEQGVGRRESVRGGGGIMRTTDVVITR